MWKKIGNFFQGAMIVPAIAAFYLFDSKIISVRCSTGQSMDPTIKENSVLIVDKIFYKMLNKEIKVGDIVVAIQPVDPKTHICKRVIQTGGNYLPSHPNVKVPEGNLWL